MDEYIKKMKEIIEDPESSPEFAHMYADDLLCEILEKHGYHEVVKMFKDMYKWYS